MFDTSLDGRRADVRRRGPVLPVSVLVVGRYGGKAFRDATERVFT
ncbi:hypothetical protein ACWEIJ_37955 [Lentzea sp. NPDC004789]